jgi:acyl carrier protein
MSQDTSPLADDALLAEVAELIVSALNLDLNPSEIESDAPLFGEGLGLDSIDVLEIALVVSKRYGFQLRSDNDDNLRIFSSLRNLAAYIAQTTNEMTGITPATLLRGIAAAGLVIAWGWLAHAASAGEGDSNLAVAVASAPLLAIVVILLWRVGRKWWLIAGALARRRHARLALAGTAAQRRPALLPAARRHQPGSWLAVRSQSFRPWRVAGHPLRASGSPWRPF